MTKPRLQDDFYSAVNHDWLQSATIPADKPAINAFVELNEDIEKLLINDTKAWAQDPQVLKNNPRLAAYVNFFQMAADYEMRDKLGTSPVKPYIDLVLSLKNFADIATRYKELLYAGVALPYDMDVAPDMKDTEHYILYLSAPGLILPDKTYYETDQTGSFKPESEQLLNVWGQMSQHILEQCGFSEKEAALHVEQALAFDASLAPFTKSGEEQADYVKMYNPYKLADISRMSSTLDLTTCVNSLFGEEVTASHIHTVIVTEPEFAENLDKFISDDTFKNYQSWALIKIILSACTYLTDDLRITAGTYRRALSGIAEAPNQEKAAFYLAYGAFSMVVGDAYAKTYFGEEARSDVASMLVQMRDVYMNRLKNNTWLSESTRAQAVKKLQGLEFHVGYPDRIHPYYDKFEVTTYAQGGNLVTCAQNFADHINDYQLSRITEPVTRDLWSMSPAMVNAYYNPQYNCIVFPAAILQAPFYSLSQPKSANYGGIGAVMAHEMSHAFDNNGSHFDERGNLANWWTQDDLDAFDQRAQDMITAWDGAQAFGGTVNGTLTVSENIADAGGISCALEAAQTESDPDLEEFFYNWARVWRLKCSEEYARMLLTIDVHSPATLRCNMQVNQLQEFYDTFKVTPDDDMYIAPDKRVAIW